MKTNEEMLLEMTAELLSGGVNYYLNEIDETVPLFEIEGQRKLGAYGVKPDIDVSDCELSEKERVIKLQAYTLTITFCVKGFEHKRLLYIYAYAIEKAIGDDPTFGGVADRVALTHKKYSGEQVVITLRATLEAF
jgi:hypothetical protein